MLKVEGFEVGDIVKVKGHPFSKFKVRNVVNDPLNEHSYDLALVLNKIGRSDDERWHISFEGLKLVKKI